MNGNGKRERRQDGGELFGGLLWSLNGALLGLNGGESGGELRVALLFTIASLLNHGVLSSQSCDELLGVMARCSPGIGEESRGDQCCEESDDIECGLHGGGMHKWRIVCGGELVLNSLLG